MYLYMYMYSYVYMYMYSYMYTCICTRFLIEEKYRIGINFLLIKSMINFLHMCFPPSYSHMYLHVFLTMPLKFHTLYTMYKHKKSLSFVLSILSCKNTEAFMCNQNTLYRSLVSTLTCVTHSI